MPIKPENRALYPANWPAIRDFILLRAADRCEDCGVANYTLRLKSTGKPTEVAGRSWGHAASLAKECALGRWQDQFSIVVLTIAHLHDPNPANCDPGNLKALCQKCHNRLDAPMRRANAAATRRARMACGELALTREAGDGGTADV